MSRVGLLCSEPLGERMGGIGIRYAELARQLLAAGLEPVVVAPEGDGPPSLPAGLEVVSFRRGALARAFDGCAAVIAQGGLADDLVRELPDLPVAIDLYDPWLVENAHYARGLGPDPYRRDLASWLLQLSRADLLLCASAEQRLYYLGLLTALGRIHPDRLAADPDLRDLIAIVPVGVPDEIPAHRPVLPPRPGDPRRRLLYGSVYEWNDPETALDALGRLESDAAQLLFARHPRAGATPQWRLTAIEKRAAAEGWLDARVRLVDWVPENRRFDLVRDVDALLVTHRTGLESDLAFRTRVVDALAVGCPVILGSGGAVSRMVAERDAGIVVPPGDTEALAAAIRSLGRDPEGEARRVEAGRELARRFRWSLCAEPVVRFARAPFRDRYGTRLEDVAASLGRRRRRQRARYLWARALLRLRAPW